MQVVCLVCMYLCIYVLDKCGREEKMYAHCVLLYYAISVLCLPPLLLVPLSATTSVRCLLPLVLLQQLLLFTAFCN